MSNQPITPEDNLDLWIWINTLLQLHLFITQSVGNLVRKGAIKVVKTNWEGWIVLRGGRLRWIAPAYCFPSVSVIFFNSYNEDMNISFAYQEKVRCYSFSELRKKKIGPTVTFSIFRVL